MKMLGIALIAVILIAGCVQQSDAEIKEKISQQLIGKELEYTTIAGKTAFYTVAEKDIASIERADKNTWKAEVGKALRWNVYFDSSGTRIIRIEQLFQT